MATKIDQHLGWLRQYLAGTTVENCLDMRGHAIAQLDKLEAALSAEQVSASERVAPGNEIGALWQTIYDHTKGDLFWIGEILLSELQKETGYSPSAPTAPRS